MSKTSGLAITGLGTFSQQNQYQKEEEAAETKQRQKGSSYLHEEVNLFEDNSKSELQTLEGKKIQRKAIKQLVDQNETMEPDLGALIYQTNN